MATQRAGGAGRGTKSGREEGKEEGKGRETYTRKERETGREREALLCCGDVREIHEQVIFKLRPDWI